MTDDELDAIEARAKVDHRPVAKDLLALVAECRRLRSLLDDAGVAR